MMALCTDSRALVHLSSASYRFFSRLCLYDEAAMSVVNANSQKQDELLRRELEAHGHLVDFAFDLALEDESNEKVLDFVLVDVQLL